MKTSVAFAALLIALNAPVAALAQTAPATRPASPAQTPRPGSGVTRDLNSLPPAAVATPSPTTTPRPAASSTTPVTTPAPRATTPAAPAPTASAPAASAPVATAPAPVATPAPRTAAPITGTPVTGAPTSPAAAPASAEPAPEPPAMTVLTAAAIAALPFTVELPAGFRITTGRPGPDFKIYTIRRGDQSFVTVYAGPASQFPIYTGETVQAGGRASIVVPDAAGQRHALEHLFQRAGAPREVHIWTSSLDGADQLLAERIAQSVDDR